MAVIIKKRGGSIQIAGERTDYVTAINGDFEIRGESFFIQDVVAKKEYWLGPYTNVENESGVFASVDALVTYLTGFFSVLQIGNVKLEDELGNAINVQNPIPSDGDSIYVKDLDLPNCDNGNFSGNVSDYFDSLKTVNEDVTANNPKTIKLWFKRTIYAHNIALGCDDLTKNFGSDITIKLLGSGNVVRAIKTFTVDNINSALLAFGHSAFNGVIIEFNTANAVGLSNISSRKTAQSDVTLHGEKDDGTIKEVGITDSGNLKTANSENGLAIAKGDVVGNSTVHKYGKAPKILAGIWADLWEGSDIDGINQTKYTFPLSASVNKFVSSDNSDAETYDITGQTFDNVELIQSVTLNGQTPVNIPIPLYRIYRMKNRSAFSSLGLVSAYENTAVTSGVPIDKTKIKAIVNGANGQTLMSIYTVPAGKTFYMRGFYISAGSEDWGKNPETADYEMYARKPGETFLLKHTGTIISTATSYIKVNYDEPLVFTEKTDITYLVKSSRNNTILSGGFDGVNITN